MFFWQKKMRVSVKKTCFWHIFFVCAFGVLDVFFDGWTKVQQYWSQRTGFPMFTDSHTFQPGLPLTNQGNLALCVSEPFSEHFFHPPRTCPYLILVKAATESSRGRPVSNWIKIKNTRNTGRHNQLTLYSPRGPSFTRAKATACGKPLIFRMFPIYLFLLSFVLRMECRISFTLILTALH